MQAKIFNLFKNLSPQARRQIRLCQAYENVFRSEDGRLVLADLVTRNNVLGTSMVSNGDHLQMAFSEGERNAVLGILHTLQMDWEEIARLNVELGEQDYAEET